jgi:hypothetical protein
LDSKVHDSKDIDELNLPLVGEVPINEEKEKIIAFRNSKSIISEAFRLVRSNISFIINGEAGKCKTILITSTIAGEGKSFVSLNLGHIYSNSGKKTVVIGMDLRIPMLDKYANISGNTGVSDFIVNESLELDDILIQDFQKQLNKAFDESEDKKKYFDESKQLISIKASFALAAKLDDQNKETLTKEAQQKIKEQASALIQAWIAKLIPVKTPANEIPFLVELSFDKPKMISKKDKTWETVVKYEAKLSKDLFYQIAYQSQK